MGHTNIQTIKAALAGVLLLGSSVTGARALDVNDLAACRPAAERFCDRTDGMSYTNLLRCGATLAAHAFHLGNACRDVLKRYGQL
jgi:hypothetical protein